MQEEFDRQLQRLLDIGYPQAAHLSQEKFLSLATPLKNKLRDIKTLPVDLAQGNVPFVIVVSEKLIAAEKKMELVVREGKTGVTKLFPHTSKDFSPIDEVIVPQNPLYLIVDIDRGKETINVRPADALVTIKKDGRSPLTIDEGIAIVTQYPDFLIKNNCFSLLASRNLKDKRVPAIWINAQKQPNLGWCWDGNPHTWLGSASCRTRLGN